MVQYPPTVDRAFAALADPTRRAVLERLGSGRSTRSTLAGQSAFAAELDDSFTFVDLRSSP
ncbi:MAG TPA: hypothetical protein VIL96_01880 [Gaiellaceae bacterium]